MTIVDYKKLFPGDPDKDIRFTLLLRLVTGE